MAASHYIKLSFRCINSLLRLTINIMPSFQSTTSPPSSLFWFIFTSHSSFSPKPYCSLFSSLALFSHLQLLISFTLLLTPDLLHLLTLLASTSSHYSRVHPHQYFCSSSQPSELRGPTIRSLSLW